MTFLKNTWYVAALSPEVWREPQVLPFKRAGIVLCKRVPALCERGDCLFQLATDITV